MKGRDESPLPFREEGWERGNHAPCPSQLRLASKLASLRISPLKGREPILLMPLSACPPAHRRAARSEEHTSELQSLMRISYAVFCLKKKNKNQTHNTNNGTSKTPKEMDKKD